MYNPQSAPQSNATTVSALNIVYSNNREKQLSLLQFGATIAAIVAALLTMFGIVVVRGTKISEMRQKWIDDQRQDIAIFLANAAQLSSDPHMKRDERLLALDTASNRIRLREKPQGAEWAEMLTLIDGVRAKLVTIPHRPCEISTESEQIVGQARIRLKLEWKRIVRGELGYRTFYITVLLVTLALAGCVGSIAIASFYGYELPLFLQIPTNPK